MLRNKTIPAARLATSDTRAAAGYLRRCNRVLRGFTRGQRVSNIPIIGAGGRTDEYFTADIARVLGYPALHRVPGETLEQFLIRRLAQLQLYSRPWANASLECLAPNELELAAMQICNAAANAAQDRLCEPRWLKKHGARR